MKTTIALTALFTASLMLNAFTFAPQCFERLEAKPVMFAEADTTEAQKGFAELLNKMTVPARRVK